MADLKEVFEMATKQIEPDQDSWKDQERRQRRRTRNRKLGAFAAVAVILVTPGIFALAQRHTEGSGLAHTSTSQAPPVTSRAPMVSPMVMGLSGTPITHITGLPKDARSVVLSPNRDRVAFVVVANGSSKIGTAGIDGSGRTLFALPSSGPENPSFPTPGAMMPAWSPDGSKIAFSDGGHIYVVHDDGSGVRQLTTGGTGFDLWPSWSPDGSTIVYSNSGDQPIDNSGFGPTQEIWTVPAAGGAPTRLTHNNVWDDMPSFAPNGRTIVFVSDGKLALMDTTGANQRPVKAQPSGFNPRWSPDGSKILYTTCCAPLGAVDGGPLLRVHIVNTTTGARTALAGLVDSDVDSPSWSSDGAIVENRYTAGT